MNFVKEEARMKRILRACEAPEAVIADFEDICRYRSRETAEELLFEICIRHNFTGPYEQDGRTVVVRPYAQPGDAAGYHSDIAGDDPVAEQAYRRGYDQGFAAVVRMVKDGLSLADIEARAAQVHTWRVQSIQELNAWPGTPFPQALPSKWDSI